MILSKDIQSSYPYQMTCKKFPIGKWNTWQGEQTREVYDFLLNQDNAILCVVSLYDVHLINDWYGNPYIAKHKCKEISQGEFDNGRVLSASFLKCVVTDIDLKIISEIYAFDIEFHDIRFSKYGYLPNEIREEVLKYFRLKTELKGVAEKKELYDKAKALLNSIYGLMAQRKVKQSIDFLIDDEFQFNLQDIPPAQLYEKYLKNPFTSYAWGVWVTAHARYDLHLGIEACGTKFVYADTDCCKHFEDDGIEENFSKLNKRIEKNARKHGAYAKDAKGKTQYMGVWDFDGAVDKFITMGAKKYASETDGKIKITVAGVNKIKGGEELAAHGGLKMFKEGFIFKEAGGLEAVYNDHILEELEIDGHKILLTDNVCLLPSTYTLGLTDEFRQLISTEQLKRY